MMDSNEKEPHFWKRIDGKDFRVFVVGVVAATLINNVMFGTEIVASVVTAAFFIGVYAYLSLRREGNGD